MKVRGQIQLMQGRAWMRMRGLAIALTLVGAACSGAASGGATTTRASQVTCDARQDTGGMCMTYFDPLDDTRRLSIISQCREAGGRLVDQCPATDLVGTCDVQEDTARAWSLNKRTQVHHYLHADVRTPAAIAGIANRCSGSTRTWTPAAAHD